MYKTLISDQDLSEEDFVKKYAPLTATEKFKEYLRLRHRWMNAKVKWKEVVAAYEQTHFYTKHKLNAHEHIS